MNSAGATAVMKSAGEARPLGFVMCSGTSESESERTKSSGDEDEAGSSWPRASCTTSTAATAAVAKPVASWVCNEH